MTGERARSAQALPIPATDNHTFPSSDRNTLSMLTTLSRRPLLAVMLCVPLLVLTACSHVPLATMVKLADFDLLKTNPATLRVAVRYPVSIRIPEGGARMMLTVKDKKTGKLVMEEKLAFVRVSSKAERAELSTELQEGRRFEIYRLPNDSIPAFKAFQSYLLTMDKSERDKIEGNMEVGVDGCLAFEHRPDRILVSTYLKADELGGYIPLLRDVDLAEQMADSASGVGGGFPRCAETGVTATNDG